MTTITNNFHDLFLMVGVVSYVSCISCNYLVSLVTVRVVFWKDFLVFYKRLYLKIVVS